MQGDSRDAIRRMGAGVRVCMVEDDADLRDELLFGLGEYGFSVRGFPGSRELYLGLLNEPCDVVIVDIGLPGEDGFSVTASLKAIGGVGVVLLTSRRSVEDRVRALLEGGDAYLVKPIDLRELAATLLCVHRRVAGSPAERPAADPPPPPPAAAGAARWSLSVDGWMLMAPSGHGVSLTASERLLMACLFDHPNEAVRREVLIEALGHRSDYYLNHRLDMLVSRLRSKVKQETGCVLPLRAVRAVGFVLSCNV
ncbi:response regulator transcription factor [Pseudothauera rhizosphaerae]|uniref:Response regulator transcription factor n=1 Tax=Pseudothauera rhizosphaerae TaxID=2565932 RepID=A0A4S4AM77_9RHOO|nr:response regulator transcription factor [Pseudothauera rhizosphaerae]THF60668.1 response regulator transcription factor [Pseudothauera rhizosphaerae]